MFYGGYMNIRLYNARILTMEKHRPIFEGEVWIKNEKIVYVGDKTEIEKMDKCLMPRINWDIEMDCNRDLLMPGFKDAHTHSGMTFLRSYADDLPLKEWLNDKVFPYEAKLSPEDIYEFTRLAILEYVSGGVTSIFDMYLTPESIAEACMDTGMRCVLCGNVNNHTSNPENMAREYEKLNKISPLITYQLGFHAEYTCTKELIYRISSLAHRYKAPVYCHLSETAVEVKDCKEKYGMTPTMFLDSMGMFEFGGGIFHGVHLTEQDMDVLRMRRVSVITNPASNLKLASGIAPIAALDRKKINVAIGTDGAASNNALDMFREMYLVSSLSKIYENDAASLDAERVLRMATVHGAKAMKLNKCDTVAKGKFADIILIDMHQPNMQPENNIQKNIVYSGNKVNVRMTMINGKILYKDGEYNIGITPEKVYEKCNEIARRILV